VLGVGIQGFANVEFKLDPTDGVFKLMEINARHNMSSSLSVRCGMDFPLMQYQHLMEGRRPQGAAAAQGVYWISLPSDLARGLKLARRGRLPRSYGRPYFSPHVYDYLQWRDPGPFAGLTWRRLKLFGAKRLAWRRPPVGAAEAPLEQPFEAVPGAEPAAAPAVNGAGGFAAQTAAAAQH
jgi:predicted ATP-grasp superfamily ATP-dependent carboligase